MSPRWARAGREQAGRGRPGAARLAAAAALSLLLAAPVPASERTEARAAALACLTCHAPETSGTSAIASLAGRDAAWIARRMAEFRTGADTPTLMDRIARGYSEAQTAALAGELERWLR